MSGSGEPRFQPLDAVNKSISFETLRSATLLDLTA